MAKRTRTADEQSAIDLLSARGYTVMRTRSAQALHERVRVAEALRSHAEDDAEHTRKWAEGMIAEERRLRDRIDELVEFAYRLGATVDDLATFNDALAARRSEADV